MSKTLDNLVTRLKDENEWEDKRLVGESSSQQKLPTRRCVKTGPRSYAWIDRRSGRTLKGRVGSIHVDVYHVAPSR
jgi:hypothetical protein